MLSDEDFISRIQKGYQENIYSKKTLEEKFKSSFSNLHSLLLKLIPKGCGFSLNDILLKSAAKINGFDEEQKNNGCGSSTENSSVVCLLDSKSMICYDPYFLMSFATKTDLDIRNEMRMNLILALRKDYKGIYNENENENENLNDTVIEKIKKKKKK